MTGEINIEHDINIHLENKKASRKFFVYIFVMYTLVYMTKNCFNGALADIVSEGVLTKSQTGLITAVFYIVYTPLQILGGIVADKVSPELMIKLSLIGSAVANAIIFFNHNYYVMLIVWTFNAVVQFALWPSTYKIITSQLCRSDMNTMIFLISITSSVGLLFSYVIAAIMPSWEYNFAFSAAVLLLLAGFLHIYDMRLSGYMIPDRINNDVSDNVIDSKIHGRSVFWKSGFLILLIVVFVRSAVGTGIKTLSPLMFVETYGVKTSVGNLLNTLIIICGLVGTLLVKFVLYPRIIKNDIFGMIIMMSLSLACGVLLALVPNMTATLISLCLMAVVTTAVSLFISYFNAGFSKYGKNGTAAGLSNSAESFGIVASSYGIVKISEIWSWGAVRFVWLYMLAISVLTFIPIVFMNIKFKKRMKED